MQEDFSRLGNMSIFGHGVLSTSSLENRRQQEDEMQ